MLKRKDKKAMIIALSDSDSSDYKDEEHEVTNHYFMAAGKRS